MLVISNEFWPERWDVLPGVAGGDEDDAGAGGGGGAAGQCEASDEEDLGDIHAALSASNNSISPQELGDETKAEAAARRAGILLPRPIRMLHRSFDRVFKQLKAPRTLQWRPMMVR